MADWYPLAIVDEGNNAGTYTDLGEPKGLLHTTEGKTYSSARAAYVANNSWPHFTVSFETSVFKVWQHNPLSLASRALKNLSGGVETNRDNVIQIEIVGTSDINNRASWGVQYVEDFPIPYLSGIRDLVRWINLNHGVPRFCGVTFKSYPSSFGTNNGVRLTNAQWDAYSGWLGHQHAPENTHGDPGLININYLLEEEVDVTPEQDTILRRIDAQLMTATDGRLGSIWTKLGSINEDTTAAEHQLVSATDGRLGEIWTKLTQIEDRIAALEPPD